MSEELTAIEDAVTYLDSVPDEEGGRVAAFNLARAVADFCLPRLAQRVNIYAILQRLEDKESS